MNRMTTLVATTFLVAGLATAANAKTLIYCSEGSPEGFDPGPYTAGTTMDAS
jgi:dipeptide transport system substrate-binding protein